MSRSLFSHMVLSVALACLAGAFCQAKDEPETKPAATEKNLSEKNFKLAEEWFAKAEKNGKQFVLGKDKDITDDKLFAGFKGESQIYNVLFDRTFKDVRTNKERTQQRALYSDRLSISKINFDHTGSISAVIQMKPWHFPLLMQNWMCGMAASIVLKPSEVQYNYGLVEKRTKAIVMARKLIKGDNDNPGGTITVLTYAEEDEVFKKARGLPATEK